MVMPVKEQVAKMYKGLLGFKNPYLKTSDSTDGTRRSRLVILLQRVE